MKCNVHIRYKIKTGKIIAVQGITTPKKGKPLQVHVKIWRLKIVPFFT